MHTIIPAAVGDDDVPVDVNGGADLNGDLLLHLVIRLINFKEGTGCVESDSE